MTRTTTAAAARPTSGPKDGGKQWTEEEKAAYNRQQERAFKNFGKYFAGQADPKTRVPFLAKVIEMEDEPTTKDKGFGPFTGTTVKVELVAPGVEGIRFVIDVTDNPDTIKNPDSALNHLYRAATGKTVPVSGVFTWDTAEILHESVEGGSGKLVMAVIQRGKDRNDGKRGGLWSELKDFQPYIAPPSFEEEEEDGEAILTKPPIVVKPKRTYRTNPTGAATVVVPAEDPELDDEVPF
jgi:hypothetical protein